MNAQLNDEVFTQKMFSLSAEQSVIGSLLKNNEAYWDIQGVVSVNDFFRREHRKIFSTIVELIENDQPADVITVTDRNKEIQLSYVGQLAKDTPTYKNAKAYAKIVHERAQKREAYTIFNDGLGAIFSEDNIHSILSDTQSRLEGISSYETGKDKTFIEVIRSTLSQIEQAKNRTSEFIGAPTGLAAIDGRTGGIYGAKLWCVAARPGVGKTAMTLQWVLHSAQTHRVGILSLEMSDEELGMRALANKLGVNMTALSFGEKSTVKIAEHKLPTSNLKQLNIWVDTNTFTLSGIVSKITEWKRNHQLDYVVVDHVGLIESDEFSTRNDQLGKITRTLKKLCKRLQMPIVIACQLGRGNERDNRKPKLSDLRDSGNIEQDIDVGVFIHASETEGSPIPVEIGLLKNRQGRKGWIPNKFHFNGATQTFSEGDDVTP